MASVTEALEIALDHHAAGRLVEAETLYGRILDAVPDQPDALHLYGLLCASAGRAAEALDLLARSVAARPGVATVHGNFASVLLAAGRTGDALAEARRALVADPTLETGWTVLRHAAIRLAAGREDPVADALLRVALAADPAWPDAMTTLARLRGDGSDLTLLRRAARVAPDADRLTALAERLRDHRRHAEAVTAAGGGLALDPAAAGLWSHLGQAQSALSERIGAATAFARAVRLAPDRPLVRFALWSAERALGLHAAYASHEGQDAFVHRTFFPDLKHGVFVDVGAYDGITWSNTLFFERALGWTGLCLEPSPSLFPLLLRNRRVPCLNVAASDADGTAAFLEVLEGPTMMSGLAAASTPSHRAAVDSLGGRSRAVEVPVRRLGPLLGERGIAHVHYCSIDAEGAEGAILVGLEGAPVTIDVFSLENAERDPALAERMAARGYDLVRRFSGGDEVYARRDLPRR